jgi:CRISPR-associated protein Cas1
MKRTILIQNPAYLKLKLGQLKIIEPKTNVELGSIPCEDIGYLILENPQITISLQAIQTLQSYKTAIISCDEFHMPQGLMLPFEGHTQMQAHLRAQIACSEPLRKHLWRQIVASKIRNQQKVLKTLGKPFGQMDDYIKGLKTGDSTNKEGQAANFYWKHILQDFTRDRDGDMPNPLLNYGYSVIRSATARALVSSGLNPSIGVFHKSKYNAFCLADDLMEPYRPYIDYLVYDIYNHGRNKIDKLTPTIKSQLLNIYNVDVNIDGKTKKLTEALKDSSSSFVQCLLQQKRKIKLPEFYVKPRPF